LRLKVLESVSSCSEDGRLFQALGPALENQRSPNFIRWWIEDGDVKWRRLMQWRTLEDKMALNQCEHGASAHITW